MSDAYGNARPQRSTTRQTSRGAAAAAARYAAKAADRGSNGTAPPSLPTRPTTEPPPPAARPFRIKASLTTSVRANVWEYALLPLRLTADPAVSADPWALLSADDAAHRVRGFNGAEDGNTATHVYNGTEPFTSRFTGIEPITGVVWAWPVETPGGEVWYFERPNKATVPCA